MLLFYQSQIRALQACYVDVPKFCFPTMVMSSSMLDADDLQELNQFLDHVDRPHLMHQLSRHEIR